MLFKIMTPKQEAGLLAISFTSVLFLGCASLIALCIAALWGLALLALTCLQAIGDVVQAIAATYHAGGPDVQLIMLLVIGLVMYRAGKPLLRRIVR